MHPNSDWVAGVSYPGNQLDIQRSIALAAALVHAVVFYMSLSNVMSCILETVKGPPWYCNSIFFVERKACFLRILLRIVHEMRVKLHPMIDW